MNTFFRAIAGVVIACSASLASAQQTTLTFDDLPVNQNLIGLNYQGYTFTSGVAVPPTLPGSDLLVLPNTVPYFTGVTGGTQNVSGRSSGTTTGSNYEENVWELQSTTNTPFYLESIDICNCSEMYVELTDVFGNTSMFLLSPFQYDLGGNLVLVSGNPVLTTEAATNGFSGFGFADPFSTPLQSVRFYGAASQDTSGFAFDNVVLTAVPEPSSYALMIAGLGALMVAARRRKATSQMR